MDDAQNDYFNAVNHLYYAELNTREAWIDLQYQNHCRSEGGGGGGHKHATMQYNFDCVSEIHKRENSASTSLDGAAAGSAASLKRLKPSQDGRPGDDKGRKKEG